MIWRRWLVLGILPWIVDKSIGAAVYLKRLRLIGVRWLWMMRSSFHWVINSAMVEVHRWRKLLRCCRSLTGNSSILIFYILIEHDFLDHLRVSHLQMTGWLIHCCVSSTTIGIVGVFRKTSNINFNALIFLRCNSVVVVVLTSSYWTRPTIIAIVCVRYLPQHSSSMVISWSHRLQVSSNQVNSCESATSIHIARWLTEWLGRLWRQVRLRFHQMWLLKSNATFQLMRGISTRMNRRIGMLKVDHWSLR